MPAIRSVLTVLAMGVALAACNSFADWPRPDSCPDLPGQGVTSNASQDTTRGASGTSSTSNGTGSTANPTAAPCQPRTP